MVVLKNTLDTQA